MNKREVAISILKGLLIVIITATIMVCGYIVFIDNDKELEIEDVNELEAIEEVMDKIETSFLGDVSKEDMIEGAIKGILESTEDPYSRYMTEEDFKGDFDSEKKKYVGIGVHISYDSESDYAIILSVMPDSPAEKAGLLAGDLVYKVYDDIITLDTYSERIDSIKGEKGTIVTLGIKRNDETLEVDIERDSIIANNIESKMLDNNIGYIKIVAFELNVSNQFITEYETLKEEGMESLIIDLRNNPGGILTEVVNLADYILPKGEIVKIIAEDGNERVYNSDSKEIDVPLVVLINDRSASASEILAGSIKDLDKGIIVGKTSYGKGIVQSVIELKEYNGAIVFTTSEYYTASGNKIHGIGITPDIEVDVSEENENRTVINFEEDLQLKKAIELLQK